MAGRIAIIDYGMGNLHSVEKAFAKVGAQAIITADHEEILCADKVVLPGVGAFGDCMANLHKLELVPIIKTVLNSGRPFLGICLGLQLLFAGSEEAAGVEGIGYFAGQVVKFKNKNLKIPQIGWNNITTEKNNPLLGNVDNEYVYFVHSYYAEPTEENIVTATTDYGGKITVAVGKNNVQAVQFHPEKSSSVGLKIIENFVKM